MNQKKKTKLTYNKILNAAIKEFGTHSYESASVNSICSENKISKGLVYHNFRNKDELYLRCVEVCFNEMTSYLCSVQYTSENGKERIHKLLTIRQRFFHENPLLGNIFFQTILSPPRHLLHEIHALRKEFDEFHAAQYRDLLKNMELRDGITPEMAIEYFFAFQEMFNGYYQNQARDEKDFISLIKNHELHLMNVIDILLYGIAKEEPTL